MARTLFILALILCSAATFTAAATCYANTQITITTADISAAATNVANNNLDPPESDPMLITANNVWNTFSGSAQLCLRNNFLFDNTHVFLADIASAARDIVSQCCNVGTTCQGGKYTVTGDSGLTTILAVIPANDACQNTL